MTTMLPTTPFSIDNKYKSTKNTKNKNNTRRPHDGPSNGTSGSVGRPPMRRAAKTGRWQHKQRHYTQVQQAFRQKVVSANQNSICNTTNRRVGRRTLRQLLLPVDASRTHGSANEDDSEAYIVPIFQRRYCWTTTQWETLWMDVWKRKSVKHSLGRLTCTTVPEVEPMTTGTQIRYAHQQQTNSNGSNVGFNDNIGASPHDDDVPVRPRSVIIDGQQRFTTVTLLLAAIRDELLSTGAITEDCGCNDSPGPSTFELKPEEAALVHSIHQMLFLDVPAMREWVETESTNHRALEEGTVLDFCRLVPTFCDRSAYLAAILPPSAPQVQRFLAKSYNPTWHRPLLAKKYFETKIRDQLLENVSNQQNETTKAAFLGQLTRSLLDGIDMLYFPVDVSGGYKDGTEDTQVIYERLAIRDATWCKPKRHSEYHSMDGTDMIRNLFLGSMDTSQSKVDFYQNYWLPLERKCYPNLGEDEDGDESKSISTFFRAFLDHQASILDGVHQKRLTEAVASPNPGLIGGRIYRDFELWMGLDLELWQQKQGATKPEPATTEDHTRDVGRRLLEFARDSITEDSLG